MRKLIEAKKLPADKKKVFNRFSQDLMYLRLLEKWSNDGGFSLETRVKFGRRAHKLENMLRRQFLTLLKEK